MHVVFISPVSFVSDCKNPAVTYFRSLLVEKCSYTFFINEFPVFFSVRKCAIFGHGISSRATDMLEEP